MRQSHENGWNAYKICMERQSKREAYAWVQFRTGDKRTMGKKVCQPGSISKHSCKSDGYNKPSRIRYAMQTGIIICTRHYAYAMKDGHLSPGKIVTPSLIWLISVRLITQENMQAELPVRLGSSWHIQVVWITGRDFFWRQGEGELMQITLSNDLEFKRLRHHVKDKLIVQGAIR